MTRAATWCWRPWAAARLRSPPRPTAAAEFITPGENGVILPQPDDIAGLTAALAAFLARGPDPEVRRAATQAVAGLSWETTVAQTLEVLAEAGS